MQSENNDFWLKLLQYGEDEEERRRKWSTFCWVKFQGHLARLTLGKTEQLQEALNVDPLGLEAQTILMEVEEVIGCLPKLPDDPFVEPSMRFREVIFEDEISFSGKVPVGADFGQAEFRKLADFEYVHFLGISNFKRAKFLGDQPIKSRVASFSNSNFHNTVNFTDTHFPYITWFKDVIFDGGALFRNAKFQAKTDHSGSPYGISNFARSRFQAEADFSTSVFCAAGAFDGAEFRSAAKFDDAKFQGNANLTMCTSRVQPHSSMRYF